MTAEDIQQLISQVATNFQQRLDQHTQTMSAMVNQHQGPPGPQGPQGPQGLAGTNRTNTSRSGANNTIIFRPNDIGYFNPPKDRGALFSRELGQDIYTEGSATYYRDVFVFVSTLRSWAAQKGKDTIKRNAFQCLRGIAQEW